MFLELKKMNTNSQTCQQHTPVTIWEINRDRLTAMQHKLSDTPKLLSGAAGRTTCSIFRVPQTLLDVNGKSYQNYYVLFNLHIIESKP